MSKSWVVTCDRCGKKEAVEFQGDRSYAKMSWWNSLCHYYGKGPTKQHSYDLCPECLKEFDEWIEKGPSK